MQIPRYRQVYESLRRAMMSGELSPGSRLPSTRALAADDLVISFRGSGTRVRAAVSYPQLPVDARHCSDLEGDHLYLHR